MNTVRPAPFGRKETPYRLRWLVPLTIMAGSLVTLVPFVTSFPILPPFGLMMLMAWRLWRQDVLAPWAPLLLGMFDDCVSGQPLGSAMLLWTLCFLMVDVIDSRLVYRDVLQNWLIGAGAIGFTLIAGRLIATPLGAHVDTALLIQIMISVALFPFVSRLCAMLDRRGQRR